MYSLAHLLESLKRKQIHPALPTNTAAFLALPSSTSITLTNSDVYRNGSIQMFIAFPDTFNLAIPIFFPIA